jgi:hypothetical protein
VLCAGPGAVQADLVIGTGAFGLPNNPDLLYDPSTGNVKIDADGAEILSFIWRSAMQFVDGAADFSDLDSDVGPFESQFADSTESQIGWASGLFPVNMGFDGPQLADIGNVFPTGLDQTGLQNLFTRNEWTSPPLGTVAGSFDLVVVPEMNAFVYLLMSSMGVLLVWSCRWLRRSLSRA